MYLGLDLGTSGVKALLIDHAQTVIGSAHGELDVSRPHPGWSEQDPVQWIKACRTAIDGLRAAHPKEFSAIAGIGLSGQMHGATLLDEQDQVLRPCILWNDTRSYREAAKLDADPAFAPSPAILSFPVLPHRSWFGLPITNRIFLRASARCCCRRTTFASG